MRHIDTRIVPASYVLAMAAWIYGFAAIDRELPALLVFVLLVLAGALGVGAGFALGRWEALALALVPALLAAAATGVRSAFFVGVAILAAFPGAPLVGLGVWLRRFHDEARDDSPDSWLYGDPTR